jgi:hypothetical protein
MRLEKFEQTHVLSDRDTGVFARWVVIDFSDELKRDLQCSFDCSAGTSFL